MFEFLLNLILGFFVGMTYPEDFSGIEAYFEELGESEIVLLERTVAYDVDFTAQAPFGEWDDERQQEGCEEASVLMAVKWARRESLTLEEAKKEILAMSIFTEEKYGEFHDTSIEDTFNWLFLDYFGFENAELVKDISLMDIKRELHAGNLVVVAMNGQELDNKYFTPPGPVQHMAVIVGYDSGTGNFVLNDPGTRQGKDFRYKSEMIDAAIHDYITGDGEKMPEQRKHMIVVRPEPTF